MAKKKAETPADATPTPEPAATTGATDTHEPSKATMRLVDAIRVPFTSYVAQYVALEETRIQFAPKFMKAYNAWAAETGKPFVAFVRLLDPTIPLASADYRKHKAFNAASNLRRLASQAARAEAAAEMGVGTGVGAEAPTTPQEAIARLIAVMLPLIALEHHERLYTFIREDWHWSDTRVSRLRDQVNAVKPTFTMNPAKGQPRPTLFLAHRRTA